MQFLHLIKFHLFLVPSWDVPSHKRQARTTFFDTWPQVRFSKKKRIYLCQTSITKDTATLADFLKFSVNIAIDDIL